MFALDKNKVCGGVGVGVAVQNCMYVYVFH